MGNLFRLACQNRLNLSRANQNYLKTIIVVIPEDSRARKIARAPSPARTPGFDYPYSMLYYAFFCPLILMNKTSSEKMLQGFSTIFSTI